MPTTIPQWFLTYELLKTNLNYNCRIVNIQGSVLHFRLIKFRLQCDVQLFRFNFFVTQNKKSKMWSMLIKHSVKDFWTQVQFSYYLLTGFKTKLNMCTKCILHKWISFFLLLFAINAHKTFSQTFEHKFDFRIIL